MKSKVDKKGKKRSLSETSLPVKSNKKQTNINELKNGPKKAKFSDIKQNGNPIPKEKVISKAVEKQKEEENKIIKQQSSNVKPSETKKDTKEKTELTVAKSKKETDGRSRNRSKRRRPYNNVNLTAEQITKKIAEIRSREVLSKRAKRILGTLNRKLKELSGNKSEKLDTVGKKNNKKAGLVLTKNKQTANNEDKTKAEKKHGQIKGKSQEEDDDSEEDEDDDFEDESEEEDESDENKIENELVDSRINKKEEVDDESEDEEDEDEDDDNDEDEDEEDEDEDEDKDDEEVESEEDEKELESEVDEEEELESEEDEEDEKDVNDKWIENLKNKQRLVMKVQNKNKQEQNKNKQEQNKNKQEENKSKQVPQSLDNQQKGEKKRYVLFVGNLPLDITENEIKQHFSTKVDTITSIRIPTKPDKTPRGFAYVEVTNNIDFENGLSLNHTFLKKRRINVQYSIPSGGKKGDAKKQMIAKSMKLQALQKAGVLAGGNQKKKPFKKEK